MDHLEARLRGDILTLDEGRLVDARFATDLYRALAGRRWARDGEDGHLSLSWARAARLVDEVRGEPLGLEPPVGGEGELSSTVEEELRRLGWTSRPDEPGTHDPAHRDLEAGGEPPASRGDADPSPGERPERHSTFATREIDEAP